MTGKVIELADQFIGSHETYREAKIACEKLFRQVSHEIELRALERSTRGVSACKYIFINYEKKKA